MSQRRRIARDASLGREVDVSGLSVSDPLRALNPEFNAAPDAAPEPEPEPEKKPAPKSRAKRKAAK